LNITRNAVWLLGCRVIGDALNLLLFIMISREFGPPGAGAYSYGFAVASFVYTIGCLGIEEYGLREYSRMEPAVRPPFLAELLGTQVVMIAAALLGVGIYLALTAPTAATLVIVSALGFYQMSAALAATLFIPAMGQQRMTGPALYDLITRAIAFGITGLAIYLGHFTISTALLGFAIAGLVLLLLAAGSAKRHGGVIRFTISHHALFSLGGILWSFASIEIFAQLFARVGVIALTLKLGESSAGLYAAGLRLTDVGLLPLAFMGVAAYPRLSQLFRSDVAAFQRVGRDLLWLMVFVGGTLAWGLYYVAPLLLVPVLGARYAGAEPVVKTIAALALIQSCEVIMGRLMLAADLQVARAAIFAIGALSALILNLAMIGPFGVNGTIYAGVLSYLLIVLLYGIALRHRSGATHLVNISMAFALSATAAAGTALALNAVQSPYWAQASVSALVFLAVAATLFLLDRRRIILSSHSAGVTEGPGA
jgi:O-antigen/teichoic acid export membrane protein